MDKTALRALGYGVYVVATMDEARPVGCVANSVMQVSSRPATVAVSINHDNYTNGCIARSGAFSVSVLSEQVDPGVIGTFGFRSSADEDKFADVAHEMLADMPVLTASVGAFACKVVGTLESATHTVFLGEVVDTAAFQALEIPMSYRYYHEVLKGKSPKNAPTFEGGAEQTDKPAADAEPAKEEGSTMKKWRCKICGYVFEGEEPPESCPMCGVGPEMFELVEE